MYFKTTGKENTEQTLKLAAARAKELGISEIVMATTTGETAYKALELCPGMKVVAVSYHAGFKKPFELTISEETRKDLESKGARVICATHALSGIERGMSKKLPGLYPALLVSDVLRMFGQGLKVAVEVAVMATDGGALSGKPCIAVGGSGKGADCALVLSPQCQSDFLDVKIHEIVCKPSLLSE